MSVDSIPMIVKCCKYQPLYEPSHCPLCFEEKPMQHARCALCEIKHQASFGKGYER